MGQAMTARAETELRISDTYLDAHTGNDGVVIDVIERTPVAAFVTSALTLPANGANGRFDMKAISINDATVSRVNDPTAAYAHINRCVKNQELGDQNVQRLTCGNLHPISIRYIYPYLTTARGISIYG